MVPHPSVPEPDSEIVLSLDGDPEPELPRSRPRIPNAALAFIAAAIVFAAGVVAVAKWLQLREPAAEEAVRSFLEAVRSGDVDAALALADERGGSDRFLLAEALDDRWEIVQVAQVAYAETAEEATAEVYAEIEAFDGTRLGHRYRVRLEDEGPLVLDGLARTEYTPAGFGPLELNGYSADTGGESHVLLLPGLYELYESRPATVDLDVRSVLALGDQFIDLGGERSSRWLPQPWPQVSPEGLEVIEAALRERLDDCAERAPVDGCPFAPPPEDERIRLPAGANWEITAYPQVTAEYAHSWGAFEQAFALFTTEPGAAEVEAVIVGDDGSERWTRLNCGISPDGVYAVFDTAGGVTLTPGPAAANHCRSMIEVE
jgi:hypothetical protein